MKKKSETAVVRKRPVPAVLVGKRLVGAHPAHVAGACSDPLPRSHRPETILLRKAPCPRDLPPAWGRELQSACRVEADRVCLQQLKHGLAVFDRIAREVKISVPADSEQGDVRIACVGKSALRGGLRVHLCRSRRQRLCHRFGVSLHVTIVGWPTHWGIRLLRVPLGQQGVYPSEVHHFRRIDAERLALVRSQNHGVRRRQLQIEV
mmetsp:Transcript_87410/g.245366  ORF Transcript_87410/g.245366 Transcript_87410/m.245366 type:complete len:206 (+) Transcript_87410:631-1248(+)